MRELLAVRNTGISFVAPSLVSTFVVLSRQKKASAIFRVVLFPSIDFCRSLTGLRPRSKISPDAIPSFGYKPASGCDRGRPEPQGLPGTLGIHFERPRHRSGA